MNINTRTLKHYGPDTLFKNVKATYSYRGDRLCWTRIPGIVTLAEIIEDREMMINNGRRNLRYEGDLV